MCHYNLQYIKQELCQVLMWWLCYSGLVWDVFNRGALNAGNTDVALKLHRSFPCPCCFCLSYSSIPTWNQFYLMNTLKWQMLTELGPLLPKQSGILGLEPYHYLYSGILRISAAKHLLFLNTSNSLSGVRCETNTIKCLF